MDSCSSTSVQVSTRRQRDMENDNLDKELKERGVKDLPPTIEEKKVLLVMLNESRAQEENDQRILELHRAQFQNKSVLKARVHLHRQSPASFTASVATGVTDDVLMSPIDVPSTSSVPVKQLKVHTISDVSSNDSHVDVTDISTDITKESGGQGNNDQWFSKSTEPASSTAAVSRKTGNTAKKTAKGGRGRKKPAATATGKKATKAGANKRNVKNPAVKQTNIDEPPASDQPSMSHFVHSSKAKDQSRQTLDIFARLESATEIMQSEPDRFKGRMPSTDIDAPSSPEVQQRRVLKIPSTSQDDDVNSVHEEEPPKSDTPRVTPAHNPDRSSVDLFDEAEDDMEAESALNVRPTSADVLLQVSFSDKGDSRASTASPEIPYTAFVQEQLALSNVAKHDDTPAVQSAPPSSVMSEKTANSAGYIIPKFCMFTVGTSPKRTGPDTHDAYKPLINRAREKRLRLLQEKRRATGLFTPGTDANRQRISNELERATSALWQVKLQSVPWDPWHDPIKPSSTTEKDSVLELRSACGRQLRPRVVPLPNEMFDLFKRNEPKVATSAQAATHDHVTVPKAAAAKSDYQFESGSDDDFRNVPPITRKTRRPLTERRKKANDLDGFIVSDDETDDNQNYKPLEKKAKRGRAQPALAVEEDTVAVCKRVGRLRATKQKAEMLIASQQHSICDTDSDYSDAIAGRVSKNAPKLKEYSLFQESSDNEGLGLFRNDDVPRQKSKAATMRVPGLSRKRLAPPSQPQATEAQTSKRCRNTALSLSNNAVRGVTVNLEDITSASAAPQQQQQGFLTSVMSKVTGTLAHLMPSKTNTTAAPGKANQTARISPIAEADAAGDAMTSYQTNRLSDSPEIIHIGGSVSETSSPQRSHKTFPSYPTGNAAPVTKTDDLMTSDEDDDEVISSQKRVAAALKEKRAARGDANAKQPNRVAAAGAQKKPRPLRLPLVNAGGGNTARARAANNIQSVGVQDQFYKQITQTGDVGAKSAHPPEGAVAAAAAAVVAAASTGRRPGTILMGRKRMDLSTCPICQHEFDAVDLAEHASTCGSTDAPVPKRTINTRRRAMNVNGAKSEDSGSDRTWVPGADATTNENSEDDDDQLPDLIVEDEPRRAPAARPQPPSLPVNVRPALRSKPIPVSQLNEHVNACLDQNG